MFGVHYRISSFLMGMLSSIWRRAQFAERVGLFFVHKLLVNKIGSAANMRGPMLESDEGFVVFHLTVVTHGGRR